jgi:hypothetical protein
MTELERVKNKIINSENLETILAEWNTNNQKIVFTNG